MMKAALSTAPLPDAAPPSASPAAAEVVRTPRAYRFLRRHPAFAWLGRPAVYAMGAIVLTGLGAGTTIIAPRLLDPASFGAFTLLTSLFGYAGGADLGLSQLADRRIAGRADGAAQAAAIMRARWVVGGLVLALLLPLTMLISASSGALSPFDSLLAATGGVAGMIANGPVTLFRAATRIWDFTFTALLLHAGMTFPRLMGILLGGVTGCFAALAVWYGACMLLLARPAARPAEAPERTLPIVRAALPLFAFQAAWLVYLTANRWISSLVSTPYELGLFSFGASLATVGMSLLGTFSQVRYPALMTRMRASAPDQASALLEREMMFVALAMIALAVLARLLAPPLVPLAFPGYGGAAPATVTLAVSCVPLGVLAWTMPMVIMEARTPVREAAVVFLPAFSVMGLAMLAGHRAGGIDGQAWGYALAALFLLLAVLVLMRRLRMLTRAAVFRVAAVQATAILTLAALAILAPAAAGPARPIATERWPVVFEETFDTLSLRQDDSGIWEPHYPWGGRSNEGNREMQYYIDPRPGGDAPAVQALAPYTVSGGILAIRAIQVPEALRAQTRGYAYAAGLLTTVRSFAFRYGKVEIRARVPKGRGLWPAFWLLPADRTWPPEIDVFEVIGHDTATLHVTAHSGISPPAPGRSRQSGAAIAVPDLSQDFHVYGVIWTPERIVWTLDGASVFETRTPRDLHKPMFLVLNLAVGGRWPGAPDGTTAFPASLLVDWIRVRAMPEDSAPTVSDQAGARLK
ncbi:family 16 glycosylhydrolase [Pseudochelatococcus lubricantis]|uniref:family 16 glycosylhydrolase n=1 Tax=Pseudochelatococcus lubricantis TaxID=1538102 RepID=UPI0035E861EB